MTRAASMVCLAALLRAPVGRRAAQRKSPGGHAEHALNPRFKPPLEIVECSSYASATAYHPPIAL